MNPIEVMLSESQERMLVIVKKKRKKKFIRYLKMGTSCCQDRKSNR